MPPAPTITLAISSGCSAAANRAAGVPTSGATMYGLPSPVSVMRRAETHPWHAARAGRRVVLTRRTREGPRRTRGRVRPSVSQMGVNAYRLSGHGLVSMIVGSGYRRCRRIGSAHRRRCGVGRRERVTWSWVQGSRRLVGRASESRRGAASLVLTRGGGWTGGSARGGSRAGPSRVWLPPHLGRCPSGLDGRPGGWTRVTHGCDCQLRRQSGSCHHNPQGGTRYGHHH